MINVVSEPFHELIRIENAITEEKDCYDKFFATLTKSKKELVEYAIKLYLAQTANRQSNLVIRSSSDIYRYMAPIMCDLAVEEFWVLMLNQSSRVICAEKLFSGGTSETMIDVRILFQRILKTPRVTSFVIVHNHPSGSIRPSSDDDSLTKEIQKGTDFLRLRLLDHVIYTDGAYFSYNDEGKL